MKDYFQKDIKVGDLIVYPTRWSSSLWMNHATVTEVGEDFIKAVKVTKSVVTITQTCRCVIINNEQANNQRTRNRN